MTALLFIFLSATLTSQSFMDMMSVVIIIYMLTQRFSNKTQFSPLTSAASEWPASEPAISGWGSSRLWTSWRSVSGLASIWTKETLFLLLWLAVVVMGLKDSPQILTYLSEWKWILNLYFMYWFLNYYFLQHRQLVTSPANNLLPSMFWRPLYWVLLTSFLYGAISYFTGVDLFKQAPLTHGKRFGGPFDDPMNFAHIYGMYLVFLTAYLLGPVGSFKNLFTNKTKILLLVTIATTAVSVFLSLTRGAWIGVFFTLISLFFMVNWRWGMSAISVGIMSALILYSNSETVRVRIDQAVYPIQGYDNERINLWRTNWEMFIDHPILGVGHGDYKKYLPDYFEKLGIPADHFQSHAHNQYLQFLSNTGILGFLFYLVFIFGILGMTYRGYRQSKDPLLLGSLGAQIAFHVGSLTECNFERAKVRLVYLFFCALALSAIAQHRKENQKNQ